MTFELLVSCVRKDAHELAEKMNIASDAVIVSQLEETESDEFFDLGKNRVLSIKSQTRGVGLNRNICIDHSNADIILFADEDIVYDEGYEAKVLKEFEDHPDADAFFFNVRVCEARRTYWNETYKWVKWYNSGRYPAYSIAVRGSKLKAAGVKYSLLFGGGAKYSNGEDSLFINDMRKAGFRMLASPVVLGEEVPRPSTWFNGYNDKLFYDRGVLYHFLYGKWAHLWGFRWVYKMRRDYADKYPYKKAKQMLFLGIKEGAAGNREFDESGKMC